MEVVPIPIMRQTGLFRLLRNVQWVGERGTYVLAYHLRDILDGNGLIAIGEGDIAKIFGLLELLCIVIIDKDESLGILLREDFLDAFGKIASLDAKLGLESWIGSSRISGAGIIVVEQMDGAETNHWHTLVAAFAPLTEGIGDVQIVLAILFGTVA